MIVAMAGLPGTGKSTLAQALATHFGGAVVSKDLLRAAAFSATWTLYTREQDDFVMSLMLQAAMFLTQHQCSAVFLDGRTFSFSYQRETLRQAARRLGHDLFIVECVCPAEVAIARIQNDHTHPAANRNAELYWAVLSKFEPIPQPKIIANTHQDFDLTLSQTIAALAPPRSPDPVAE